MALPLRTIKKKKIPWRLVGGDPGKGNFSETGNGPCPPSREKGLHPKGEKFNKEWPVNHTGGWKEKKGKPHR